MYELLMVLIGSSQLHMNLNISQVMNKTFEILISRVSVLDEVHPSNPKIQVIDTHTVK